MEPRGSMETGVDPADEAGSNALVAVVGYYTKLLSKAVTRYAALLTQARAEARRAAEMREEWAKADRERVAALANAEDATNTLRDIRRETGAYTKRLAPLLKALDAYFGGADIAHAAAHECLRQHLGPVPSERLADLHHGWLAFRADRGVVPKTAPPRPDPPRTSDP